MYCVFKRKETNTFIWFYFNVFFCVLDMNHHHWYFGKQEQHLLDVEYHHTIWILNLNQSLSFNKGLTHLHHFFLNNQLISSNIWLMKFGNGKEQSLDYQKLWICDLIKDKHNNLLWLIYKIMKTTSWQLNKLTLNSVTATIFPPSTKGNWPCHITQRKIFKMGCTDRNIWSQYILRSTGDNFHSTWMFLSVHSFRDNSICFFCIYING